MDTCPRCGSSRVFASRHRGAGERLRQLFTTKRPYRCHTCGWREWTAVDPHAPIHPDMDTQSLREAQPSGPLDARALDRLEMVLDTKRPHSPGPLPEEEIDAVEPDAAES